MVAPWGAPYFWTLSKNGAFEQLKGEQLINSTEKFYNLCLWLNIDDDPSP
jgi:hypothetical protein